MVKYDKTLKTLGELIMDNPIPVESIGGIPVFTNFFVMFWTLLNILIPLAIVALIFWYLKKQTDYRNQLLNRLDTLILLLQQKNANDK